MMYFSDAILFALSNNNLLPRRIADRLEAKWAETPDKEWRMVVAAEPEATTSGKAVALRTLRENTTGINLHPDNWFDEQGTMQDWVIDQWLNKKTVWTVVVLQKTLDWKKCKGITYDGQWYYFGPITTIENMFKITPEEWGYCPKCIQSDNWCECGDGEPESPEY